MTEQKPDPAAGASRWEAPAAGSLRPATDLAAASEQLLDGGSRQLDSAALRDALLDLHDFWLTTKAAEIGITADQWLRDRRHRRAGPRRTAAVLRPRPDAAARQHAGRRGQSGRRDAVVPVVGRQHSHRPQRADRARGAEGRRRRHLGGPGHARGAAHRRRRRPVVAADQRRAPAVAHRNRLAFRRTRRAHPGALAAQRSDRPSRRAGPQEAAAAGCATSNCSTRWPSRSWPTCIPAGHWPRRRAHSATRTWRCSNVRTELHRVSGRGRELLLAQHADEIGAALRIGDRFDLARTAQ